MANFYEDVIKKDGRFDSVNRVSDIALLEPVMREIVEKIIAEAKAQGVNLMVYETYRSQARQLQEFNEGNSQIKTVGVHHYGLACDIVKNVGGQPSWDGSFTVLGQLAHANKLIWGHDWGTPGKPHKLDDFVHVQRCSVKDQTMLFNETWYPDESYNPYDHL